jgi:molybdenum cofactor biosynthesis enzyme MoaA
MSFDGYLDANDGWSVQGWAFDARRPFVAVEVELTLPSGFTATLVADEFRLDLLQNGMGDGCHAFRFSLPPEVRDAPGAPIVARIRGTDFALRGSPMPLAPRDVVELVAGDIVNNCNLRCPFCMVDYANIRGLKTMAAETFRRALDLAPLLPPGGLWLSCLHEPTLHPQFAELIESIPPALRDRISFTTNLARKLPENFLERLANSGVHSIRVSFDSRDAELFGELRKGAVFATFEANLNRLGALLRTSPRRPRLHLITMAFRDNQHEITDLIRHGREVLGAGSHEVRFMYYLPHLAQWGKERILSQPEWDRLEAALARCHALTELTVSGPRLETRGQFEHEDGVADYVARDNAFGGADDGMSAEPADPAGIGRRLRDEPLRLRLRWDGLVLLDQCLETEFRVNLNRLNAPGAYFLAMRAAAKSNRTQLRV